MRKAFFLTGLLLSAFGCASNNKVPKPTATMAEKSGYSLDKLKRGHEIYTGECTRCHEPMMPSELSGNDWHVVVPGMAWNAGISEADEDAVMKYIFAVR